MASGMACYHHPSQRAVAQCRVCGNGICQDCYDVYGVTSGEYAGKALCYDCTSQLVAENVVDIDAFRARVKRERIFIIVGAVLGALVGIAGGGGGVIIGAGIGGSLWTIVKTLISALNDESWIVAIGVIIVSPIITIYRFISRFRQERQCREIISSDSYVLREMRDYFEYTQVMEQNDAIDLSKLADKGGELYDNSYAQSVITNGESAAQAELRRGVIQIAANGEIIRGFDRRTVA